MSSSSTVTHEQWATPSVLRWARQQAALELEEAAKSLNISVETLQAWEEGVEHPNSSYLRQLSITYDCPFAYFFLKALPEELPLTDYRGTPKERRLKLSRETRLSLREFRRLTRLARMLEEITGVSLALEIGKAYKNEDPEIVAEREAKRLGVTKAIREAWLNKESAYHTWREAIEALGVFVFSLRMPVLECRGAAIREEPYTIAILVNQNDAPTARSFTLLHEYGHLLLKSNRELMLCDQFPSDTESFANRFASSVLVPKDEFLKILQDKKLDRYQDWWPDTALVDLADVFCVSRDVIAIRLENLELAPSGFYTDKRKQWDRPFKPGGFGRARKKKVYAQEKFGSRLFNLTLEAVQTGIIHPADAALYIGKVGGSKDRPWFVKLKDVEKWIEEGQRG